MPKAFLRSHLVAVVILTASGLRAEPAVIGLARAYLGPDSTLDSIQSIHFVGTLDRQDPDHSANGTVHATLDVIFAKPARQRQVLVAQGASYTTVLDGYDAWSRSQSLTNAAQFRMEWLSATEVRSLQASTWENLHFFRGLGEDAIEDKGPATIDGIACERVDFTHGPDLVFQRYFDRDTGRLVLTMRATETIRESGEMRADGVRFPKSIVTVAKTASGKDLVSTVTFTQVSLNEPVGSEVFAAPSSLPIPAAAAGK